MSDTKAPDYIYLQLDGDGGDEYVENCATWSEERVFDTDVQYRRVAEGKNHETR